MKVYLVDGTYELFRAYFGAPKKRGLSGREVGASAGILRSLLFLLRDEEVTHVACAFDHVIESFRNDLFPGYKTGDGIDPRLHSQFELAERAAHAMGLVVWPMVEFEADDALATAAHRFTGRPEVTQVVLCSPDKDLMQCVRGERVVSLDRRQRKVLGEAAVREKFGIAPTSIPDYLALVGDSADGLPGIPRWGPKSASLALAEYQHLEHIPGEARAWRVKLRGAEALAESLSRRREDALLYRRLATLRTDVPLGEDLADLEWRGARREELAALCAQLGDGEMPGRMHRWRE